MRHHGRHDGGRVWSLTVQWLSNGMMASGMLPSPSLMPLGPALTMPKRERCSKPIVKVLDRASEHTIVVSWCDSQGGHFGDQTWRLASAKKRGICAMTGRIIEKGEAVYRPWLREKARSNANERILAECVDAALSAQARDD